VNPPHCFPLAIALADTVSSALHSPSPSLLLPLLSTLPAAPDLLNTCIHLISAFTNCLTPESPFSLPFHRGLAISVQISLSGAISAAHISLSDAGLDTENGLLHIPAEPGYRAFDVFYHLLSPVSTQAERQGLGLQSPDSYTLLARSNTYTLPNYLPTADDTAAAEDWRANMRAIGIKGGVLRGLLSVLAGILKLGNSVGLMVDEEMVEEVCSDVAALLGIDPEVLAKKMSDGEREHFIATVYELVVEWVIAKANEAILADFAARKDAAATTDDHSQEGDTVQITVLELPNEKLARAVCLKGVFDDGSGLNIEMKSDGVPVPSPSSTVVREVKAAWSDAEAASLVGMGREREYEHDRREQLIEKAGREVEDGGFLKEVLFPGEFGRSSATVRLDVSQLLAASRAWYHLNINPTAGVPVADDLHSHNQPWSAAAVSRQLRAWRLPEWANRRNKRIDFTADFDFDEFAVRYAALGCSGGRDGVESWVLERGWSNGEVVVGSERVWMREPCWWEAENMLDMKQPGVVVAPGMMMMGGMPMDTGYTVNTNGSGFFPPMGAAAYDQAASREQLLRASAMPDNSSPSPVPADGGQQQTKFEGNQYTAPGDVELGEKTHIEERNVTTSRKIWVAFVWATTFWIPSFLLRHIGRMKRPDVRFAWREKLVLCWIIFFMNALIIFWIVVFARLLCPDIDKAWSRDNVARHQGDNDFWVSIHGQVYDITNFYRLQHSDITGQDVTSSDMLEFAGEDLSAYFPPLFYLGCPGLVTDKTFKLQYNDTSAQSSATAVHWSGSQSAYTTSALYDPDWYAETFLPRITEYWTGVLVWDKKDVKKQGVNLNKPWAIIDDAIYDLTDYFYTAELYNDLDQYHFLDSTLEDLFQNNPGSDITELYNKNLNATTKATNMRCLKNMFYVGKVDFRYGARCQASGYVLLAFAVVMCTVIGVKFLAALQLGTKRRPAQQDKFVICQVPAYTEGEDQLRKGLDSLTAMNYDNKRKLLFVICDGIVVGGGNDRPTPNLVLEILGVDPKIDPPALPFKSVGEGNAQLNYGKVYSGLYEYEGCVVPYIVVVKCGKPTETSKPGNRGKRDSQVLVLDFLNKVHHRTPMSPLQLEMFHQINNIIGVDPELYEYILMVDADTSVKEDALNRLVAACAHDAKIVGICGETSLENEERSWWTMIQVYEYVQYYLSFPEIIVGGLTAVQILHFPSSCQVLREFVWIGHLFAWMVSICVCVCVCVCVS
jgi:chitin synthase